MSSSQSSLTARQWRQWRMRIFAAGWLTYAGFYLGRVNLAVAVPAMQAQFGWSKATLGVLGSAFYWVYALSQLLNGHLGDRVSARRFVTLGLLISALLNLLMSGQRLFGLMLLIWALNGWAQATGWGPIMKTLSRWFTPQQRGRLTAFFTPCYVAGHALSWALAGWMIAVSGWRAAFWVPGLILLGVAALWYGLVRDEPAALEAPTTGAKIPLARQPKARLDPLANLRGLASQPALRWGLVVCFLSGMIKDGLTLWGPTFLMEQQGLSLSVAALTGTVIPISGALGALLAGWLVHTIARGHEAPVVAGLAGLMTLAVVGLYLLGGLGQVGLVLFLLGALALGSHGMNALLMASLPLRLGPQGNVSSAAGTLDFASYVGGGLSAVLVGWLQDALGWGAVYVWWAGVALAIGVWSVWQISALKRTV